MHRGSPACVGPGGGEGWDELIEAQFLVPEDMDDCAYYNEISALLRAYNRKKGVRAPPLAATPAASIATRRA